MKAIIDRSGCIGCGLCTEICPRVFRMGEDGLAEVYSEVDASDKECVKEACDSCPVSVITAEE
jgi:ferredoxin